MRNRNKVNLALKFIEANLAEGLSVREVADHVAVSPFHFQRLFVRDVGESVAGYIRRRRLEYAANTIFSDPHVSMIQVALNCGFETHSAFSKSFKQHFCMSPSEFVNGGGAEILKNSADSRPFLMPLNKSHVEMDVDFLDLPDMWLQHRQQVGVTDGVFFPDQKVIADGFAELMAMPTTGLTALCGAYLRGPKGYNDSSAIGSYGAIFSERPSNAWGGVIEKIEACRWAVFSHFGSYEHLHLTWNKACRNWLPNNKLAIKHEWMLETYMLPPDSLITDRYSAQILIPLENSTNGTENPTSISCNHVHKT